MMGNFECWALIQLDHFQYVNAYIYQNLVFVSREVVFNNLWLDPEIHSRGYPISRMKKTQPIWDFILEIE